MLAVIAVVKADLELSTHLVEVPSELHPSSGLRGVRRRFNKVTTRSFM